MAATCSTREGEAGGMPWSQDESRWQRDPGLPESQSETVSKKKIEKKREVDKTSGV